MKRSRMEHVFSVFNIIFMILMMFVTIYPFWSVLVHSLNDAADSVKGGLWFFPRKFTLDNYRFILGNNGIFNSILVSAARTVVGTITSVFCMSLFSYALTKRELILRSAITTFMAFTMFFSGGLIPYYLLITSLGLKNSFLVYIIPALYGPSNIIIMRTYFRANIPQSLEEAAKIDGYNDLEIFFRVVVPISTPILATISLFMAVGHWNDWFVGYMYINNENLLPLQTILMRIINQAASQHLISGMLGESGSTGVSGEAVRNAVMVVAIIPIVIVYPSLQKYFVKGVMIGSIKE